MLKNIALLFAVMMFASPAHASAPQVPATVTNLSGTIATTNTFQLLQSKTGARLGCFIQNQTSADTMWVFFGAIANATKASAAQLGPGQWVNCQTSSNILIDSVSITGTSGDAFFASFQ